MRRVILLSLVLVTILSGLLLGPAFVEYQGYVLIVLESGTLQLSIFGLLFSIVVVAILGWALWSLARWMYRILSGSQQWFGALGQRKQRNAFYEGLIALAEGNLDNAQVQLAKVKDARDFRGVGLLAEAEAKSQLGQHDAASSLWEQALLIPACRTAATIALVKQDVRQGNPHHGLERLKKLDVEPKSNNALAKTWLLVLARNGRWKEVKDLLPSLKKVLGEELEYWKSYAANGEYEDIASREGALPLKQRWESKPRASKKDPAQISAYVKQLIAQGLHSDAETILVNSAGREPHPLLLPYFRQLKLTNPAKAIKQLEAWIKSDENDRASVSTLAELAFHSGDLLLAEKAVNKAITLGSDPDDLAMMARIQEAKQDHKQALMFYKQSAAKQ